MPRARSTSPSRKQTAAKTATQSVAALTKIIKNDDADGFRDFVEENPKFLTSPVAFKKGKELSLSHAIRSESWDIVDLIVLELLDQDQLIDLERSLQEADSSFAEFIEQDLDFSSEVLEQLNAAIEGASTVVSSQPSISQDDHKNVPAKPGKYHRGVFECSCSECCQMTCCICCNQGVVYGGLNHTDWKTGSIIMCLQSLVLGTLVTYGIQCLSPAPDPTMMYQADLASLVLSQCATGATSNFAPAFLVNGPLRRQMNKKIGYEEPYLATIGLSTFCLPCTTFQMMKELERIGIKASKD